MEWGLNHEMLSKIAHVSPETLEHYLKLSKPEIDELPSIPVGLGNAMPLVGVYRRVLTVYKTAAEQQEWLERPNSVFEGKRPIEIMAMSPEHLAYVSYIVESGIVGSPRS